MSSIDLRLEAVNTTTPEATLRAIARHNEALRAERMPEDPPLNEAATLAELRHKESAVEKRHFVLWDGAQVVAQRQSESADGSEYPPGLHRVECAGAVSSARLGQALDGRDRRLRRTA